MLSGGLLDEGDVSHVFSDHIQPKTEGSPSAHLCGSLSSLSLLSPFLSQTLPPSQPRGALGSAWFPLLGSQPGNFLQAVNWDNAGLALYFPSPLITVLCSLVSGVQTPWFIRFV